MIFFDLLVGLLAVMALALIAMLFVRRSSGRSGSAATDPHIGPTINKRP